MPKSIPNFTFTGIFWGRKETPWDLRVLLFKGGASARVNRVAGLIDAGVFGAPITERFALIKVLHAELQAALTSGGSKKTTESAICNLRYFFRWVDLHDRRICLNSVENTFIEWSDYLLHRVRGNEIKEISAYRQALTVGSLIDKVIERTAPIIKNTRLTAPPTKKRVRGVIADKQNLADTFSFGHTLLDIVDGLSIDAIWGALPLRLRLRNGKVLEEWSGLIPFDKVVCSKPQDRKQRYYAKLSKALRERHENDRTLRTRYPLVNLRIEAELLLFIGETGMNLSQAHQLKIRQYSYKSTIDGYEVRDFKSRRNGEVQFEIFSEYKGCFERYLAWRKAIFPDDSRGLLFPIVRRGGRAESTPPNFGRVLQTCKKLGLKFVSPRQLRHNRINWMLRRSRDENLVSEQAQHFKETLIRIYEEPSLQVAMVEITRFWQSNDPALQSIAPGICDGVPVPIADMPSAVPKPDCVRPTGCLWCEHHRDIDSQDYIWSVASMRHLKILALKGCPPPVEGKTVRAARYIDMTIERLTAKLHWFKHSNQLRCSWVDEALARMDEGFYHPHWHYLIAAVEGE